jgi:uncharacterized protein (DUF488 family)
MATLYTIGHSTRAFEELVEILNKFDIKHLVDVRTIPKSKYNPQFNKEKLSLALPRHHIHYEPMPGLGGLRHAKKDSINLGWRNSSFRGYADYMQTEEFKDHLLKLMTLAKKTPTAIMCAEAVPWRCHRSLIADALVAKRWKVINILGLTSQTIHKLNPMAKIKEGKIYYPADDLWSNL